MAFSSRADLLSANAAVLYDTTFRIVLRSYKDMGKHGYEACLLEGGTHKILASAPGSLHLQESLYNLLIELSSQMANFLTERAEREKKAAEERGEGKSKQRLGHEVPIGKDN